MMSCFGGKYFQVSLRKGALDAACLLLWRTRQEPLAQVRQNLDPKKPTRYTGGSSSVSRTKDWWIGMGCQSQETVRSGLGQPVFPKCMYFSQRVVHDWSDLVCGCVCACAPARTRTHTHMHCSEVDYTQSPSLTSSLLIKSWFVFQNWV